MDPKSTAASARFIEGASGCDWFTPGRFALVLALLIAATFATLLAGFDALAYFDAGQFAYPVAYYHRESFWHGELPLWNPLNSCGIPFLAQWNTMTLYPLSLIYLLLPLPWSFGFFCLCHLFLAGLGMQALALRWTGSRLGAAVAGVAFAFNGMTWYGLMWPHLLAALAWMPWLVLTMERAWREGRRQIAIAALVGALQLLSGGAEVILLTWILLGLLWVWHIFRGEVQRVRLTSSAIAVCLLAAGLAAAQLLPFLDLLAHSQRDAGYGRSELGSLAAMPPTGWANFLVPAFHCARNPHGLLAQVGQSWTCSYYVGATVVVLAMFAAWRSRQPRIRLLTGLMLLSLLLALGKNGLLLDWLNRVLPVFAFMRFPVKFLFLTLFALPLLSACGIRWLETVAVQERRSESRRVMGVAVGALIAMGGIVLLAAKSPAPAGEISTVLPNAAVRALILILVLRGLIALGGFTEPRWQRLLQPALIALLWLDVLTHAPNLSPTAPAGTLKPGIIAEFFQWNPPLTAGVSRALQGKDSFWRMLDSGSPDLDVDVKARRLSLFMNYNLLDGAAKFDGFYSLDLREYLDVFKRIYFTTNEATPLKDFLGISQITSPTNLVGWMPRTNFMPLVTAGQSPVFATAEATLATLISDSFEPRGKVILPETARDRIVARGQTNAVVSAVRFSAHRLEFQVEASAPAMVVIAQSFYHPWRAHVDGQPTPIWRADHAFQALQVPAGRHEVKLTYEDRAFKLGALLSALSLVICLVVWLRGRTGGD